MKYVRRILAFALVLLSITTTAMAVNIVEDKSWPDKEMLEEAIEKDYGFDINIEVEDLSELEYMNYLTAIEYSLSRYNSNILDTINNFYNQNGQSPAISIYSTEDYLGDYMLKNKEYIGIKLNLPNKSNNSEAYKTIYKAINTKIDSFIYEYLEDEDKLDIVCENKKDSRNILNAIDTYYTHNPDDNYVEKREFCSMLVDMLTQNKLNENKYQRFGLDEPKTFTLLNPITGESTLYKETDNVFYDINIYNEKEDIYFLYKLGVITGSKDGSFKPNEHITRFEATAMASKLIKLSEKDINKIEEATAKCDILPELNQQLTLDEAKCIIDSLTVLFN